MMNKKVTEVALALGGNMGNVPETFRRVIRKLEKAGLCGIRVSGFYRTDPMNCESGAPDFINAALTGRWPKTLKELHSFCKKLEIEAGRPADHPKCFPRPLDIDIIFFGDKIYKDSRLTVPHKDAGVRLFVLMPLSEIAGDWKFPGRKTTVSDLLQKFSGGAGYKKILCNRIPFEKNK